MILSVTVHYPHTSWFLFFSPLLLWFFVLLCCLDTRQNVWCSALVFLLDNLNTILIWISAVLTAALDLRLSVCPSAWAASSHISHALNRCSMGDVIGCCHINCACFGRVSVRVCRCGCVGVLNTPLNCCATTTARTTYVRPVAPWPTNPIWCSVSRKAMPMKHAKGISDGSVRFASVRFGSVWFDFGSCVRCCSSVFVTLPVFLGFSLAFAFFALCRDFGFVSHNRQAATTATKEPTITRSKCANIMKNAKHVTVARVGRTYLPDIL